MNLNQYETESALWKKIETELLERLQTFRERNDGDLEPLQTQRLRGAISVVKEILSWKDNPVIIQSD